MDIDDLEIDFKPIHRGLGLHQRPKMVGPHEKSFKPELKKVEVARLPVKTEDIRDYIKKASLMERLPAFVIDVLMTFLFFSVFIVVTASFYLYFEGKFFSLKNIFELKLELLTLYALIYITYFSYLEGFSGQTIGKKWCSLEVFWTHKDFLFFKALLRVLTSPFFYLFSSEKDYLQDRLSHSKVVKVNAV